MFPIRNCFANGLCLGALASAALVPVPTANAATESAVYSFCSQTVYPNSCTDGYNPIAGLIEVKGTLYGTTQHGGGSNSDGTVFKIDPTTGVEKVLYAFQTNGTSGVAPWAGMIDVNGTLYGTTPVGGRGSCITILGDGCGAVFRIDRATGEEKVLYAFKGGKDGALPVAGLIDVNGILYGTTTTEGAGFCSGSVFGTGCGIIFEVNPTTGTEKLIHTFKGGRDGAVPVGGLIDVDGTLYGTTSAGGTGTCGRGCGTVFSMTPNGTEKVLYSFKGGSDGATPQATLIDVGGTLYGTTTAGGTGTCTSDLYGAGCGTVFTVNPTTGVAKVIYTFKGGSDGASPEAGLIDVGIDVYGTTIAGGTGTCSDFDPGPGCGTVFKINTATGVETVLHSFENSSADGAEPFGGLIDVGGTLYGTTSSGGAYDDGVVFKITR